MSHQNSANKGVTAKGRGALRKRRRHRAWRREATKEVREKINEQKRAERHPGWVEPECRPAGNFLEFLRSKGFVVEGDDDNGFAVLPQLVR